MEVGTLKQNRQRECEQGRYYYYKRLIQSEQNMVRDLACGEEKRK
jgi:hypothetical protein